MAIGSVAGKCGPKFAKYVPSFKPFLIRGLHNTAEYHVCIVSVGVVSEICAALQKDSAPYCDEIMQALLQNLQVRSLLLFSQCTMCLESSHGTVSETPYYLVLG